MEDVNTTQLFSFDFCELRDSCLEFNSWKIVYIWKIKRVEIRAMKFEAELPIMDAMTKDDEFKKEKLVTVLPVLTIYERLLVG